MADSIENMVEWRIIGETVPGASHLRSGTPNQDMLLQMRESGRTLPLILSLADGHGSPKCFRSDLGSRFAVKKAVQIIGEFLDERRGHFDLAEIENAAREHLPKELVKKWRKTVEYHLKNNPFTEDEFKKLEEKSGAGARQLIEENPLLAYGTTLLAAALEQDLAIYLQLGDGDILNVSAKGEVTKPLAKDDRLLANETTSMCLPKAEDDFRFFLQKISLEESPALILLSTDGYLNSFADEAGFFQAGTDILNMLADPNGYDAISDNLKGWLEEATKMGSGDDCTVGLIYRPDLLKKPESTETDKVISITETASTPEISQAITVLTAATSPDSQPLVSEDMEDVTVTITIKKDKKDKSKIVASPAPEVFATPAENAGPEIKENK